MRKLAAIILLLLLVFNFCGYRLIFSYLEDKATDRLVQRIDAGRYDESSLVEIKIPMQLPYYSNWSDYQPYYGETEWEGKKFQFVKRKLVNDTLYLLCINDTEKNSLESAKHDYFKSVSSLQHDAQNSDNQPASVKLMLSEYVGSDDFRNDLGSSLVDQKTFVPDQFLIPQFDPLTPAQPPEKCFLS